jgi:hypothetical protein
MKYPRGGQFESKNNQFCHRDEHRSSGNEHGSDQQKHNTEAKKESSGDGETIDHSIITPKQKGKEKVLHGEYQG